MAEAWTNREVGVRASSNIDMLREVSLETDAGVSGRAIRTRQVEWTGDYLADTRFTHTPARDTFVRESGIESVIAAPLVHREVVVGAITVYGDRADAFDAEDAALLAALADQAAVAIANARLIDELERSRGGDRPARRLRADLARDRRPRLGHPRPGRGPPADRRRGDPPARVGRRPDRPVRCPRSTPCAGRTPRAMRWSRIPEWASTGGLKPGQAVAGTAFAEQRPVRTDDYLIDDRFVHDDAAAAFVDRCRYPVGHRRAAGRGRGGPAPETTPLGTLSVVSRQPGAYDEADGEVLTALATQASIAIRNARLIEELARSRAVIERRAEAERALREIATRITAIREPGDLLQRIVDEARRLLRADGAVIDEYDAEEGVLVTAYDAGLTEEQRESVRSPAAADRRGPVRAGDGRAAASSPPATTWRASSSTSPRRTRWPARPASAT